MLYSTRSLYLLIVLADGVVYIFKYVYDKLHQEQV